MTEEVASSPRRVVSLQPSATAILAEIGELDKLVACTKYCLDICPQLAETKCLIVKDSWTAHSQQILAAQPDLVVAPVPYQEESVSQILKAGVRFLGLAPHSLADIYCDIACIAGIMGAERRGELVIGQMKEEIRAMSERITDQSRPLVYCEEWGKPLIASQLWVAELIEAAGGKFLGVPGARTTNEAVRDSNPDVIVASWCGAGDRVPLERIVSDRGWKGITAAKRGHVFCVRDEFLNTPAPTLLNGLRALAAAIHPEIFPEAAGLRRIAITPTM